MDLSSKTDWDIIMIRLFEVIYNYLRAVPEDYVW